MCPLKGVLVIFPIFGDEMYIYVVLKTDALLKKITL